VLAVDRLCVKMRTTLELPPAVIENFVSSLQWVVAQGHARVAALRVQMYWVIKVLMTCGMGIALFVYAVSQRSRDRYDRVVARLLRSMVADERGENHDGQPDCRSGQSLQCAPGDQGLRRGALVVERGGCWRGEGVGRRVPSVDFFGRVCEGGTFTCDRNAPG